MRPALTLHPYKPLKGEGEGHRRPEVRFPVEQGFEGAAHGERRSGREGVSRPHRQRCTPEGNGIGPNHFHFRTL